MQDDTQTFWEHLAELRKYALYSFASITLFGSVVHMYRDELIALILRPLHGMTLQFLSPLDPLLFVLKLDFIGGFLLSLPIIIWGVIRFAAPALPAVRVRMLLLVLTVALLFGAGAAVYAYLVAIPLTLAVLLSVNVPGTVSVFTADGYFTFFLTAIIMLMIVFEMPIVMVALTRFGILQPKTIAKKRPKVYLALLIAVAAITPTTDLVSLALILIPTYAIFEIGLLGTRMVHHTKR